MRWLIQIMLAALSSVGCSVVTTADAEWDWPKEEELPPDHFREGPFIVKRSSD